MKKILIIYDAKSEQQLLHDMLEGVGYEICGETDDGQKGIELFEQLKPDLTICDIKTHGMDDADCIRQILSKDQNARILACAAAGSDETIKSVRRLGIKGVIKKPIDVGELVKRVGNAFREAAAPNAKSFKALLEERAAAEGIGLNSLLDYCSAFKSINGFALDDPKVTKQYLKQNGDSMIIGMRALVSAKISLDQLNKLERIFQGLVS